MDLFLLLLGLMASGLNGQQFCFRGYLPIETSARLREIRNLEQTSSRQQSTEIFMETPYRNQSLLETLLKTCRKETMLCIAAMVCLTAAILASSTRLSPAT